MIRPSHARPTQYELSVFYFAADLLRSTLTFCRQSIVATAPTPAQVGWVRWGRRKTGSLRCCPRLASHRSVASWQIRSSPPFQYSSQNLNIIGYFYCSGKLSGLNKSFLFGQLQANITEESACPSLQLVLKPILWPAAGSLNSGSINVNDESSRCSFTAQQSKWMFQRAYNPVV